MEPDEVRAFIDSKLCLPVVEGEDKVCALDEAIRTHVRSRMSIGFAGRGGALVNQLVREFWNKDPGFTIINTGISATVLSLLHGRLAKKIIASFIGDVYPSSGRRGKGMSSTPFGSESGAARAASGRWGLIILPMLYWTRSVIIISSSWKNLEKK